jgi:sulfur-carrier protein adenylyltransferase/sulfurtransferase
MRPLVAPGPPLPLSAAVRSSRHTVLPEIGDVGQRRLRSARVCVVGAGGLGSPALLYLAAAGVGRIGVVDRDVVDVTNLQRQVLHTTADVGRRKVASARDAVLALDPDVDVRVHDVDLTAATVRDVLGGYDVVLDGSDNFLTRYLVNDACAALGVPLVWGSVLGFHAQVAVFWSRPPDGAAVDLRDLFPEPPRPGDVPSCAEAGVVGALCGQVGALIATGTVKLVTGAGEPLLGRLLTVDALTARWREVPLRRAADGGTALPEVHDAVASCLPPTASPDEPPVPTVTAAELDARLRAGEDLVVVDVRERAEHAAGAIAGSVAVPLSELRAGDGLAAIPRDMAVVLHCAVGVRSREALRLLLDAGHPRAAHLDGGIHAWWAHVAVTAGAHR